jgi:O-antigen/teichoic acid export membrane protein
MQKKFVTNLALLLFLNLLIKPFWVLGIDREVQNAVGTANYGEYFALFNFSFLLNILLDIGITNFNNKNIAQNNHLLSKHFSSLIVLKLGLALTYICITLICGLVIGYDFRLMKMLIILGFNQFLISFILYLRSNLAGLHLFKTDSIISVLDRIIMISICAVLLWGHVTNGKLDIMWFIYAQTFSYALTAFITFLIVIKKTHFLKLRWSWPFTLMILKQSFPFAVLVLLMTFYNRIDAVMLERLLGDEGKIQSGIYAQSYRLLDATNMIAYLFAGLLLPIFSKMLKQKESVEQLVKLAYVILITPAILIAGCCVFYSSDIMILLYNKNYIPGTEKVFALLMSCFIAISTTYVFGTLLTANGNLKELNIMAGSGMLINILLNFYLIPRYFALGAAVSSMITQFLTAAIQLVMVHRFFKFRVNYKLIGLFLLFIAGVALSGYVTSHLQFDWKVRFGLMVLSCGAWAFAIRLFSIRSMYRIFKYG